MVELILSASSDKQKKPLLLQGGRVIDPANGMDCKADVLVMKGRIAGMYTSGNYEIPKNTLILPLDGKWVVPGLIDMHVHLREPGEEYKETIETGTRAAAAGGFTAVACMPNTRPVNDSQDVTSFICKQAKNASSRVYPVGAISRSSEGKELAEFGEMKEAGIVAVSDDGRPVVDSQLFRRALEYGSYYGLLVISHSEEEGLSKNGVMNEGVLSTKLGLRGVPSIAESIMIYRDLAVARYTGLPVHIAHVSTRESVDLIKRAKETGCSVTAETAPHYFTLTETAIGQYDTLAKMNPPLRTQEDSEAIRQALADGTIDVIATDHAPHSQLEKDLEFDMAANGVIGLETAVPLALQMVRDGILDERRFVELLSVRPAEILGVQGGNMAKEMIADITVIDPEKRFRYTGDSIISKSSNSPFLDWELQGKAVLTIVGGNITMQDL